MSTCIVTSFVFHFLQMEINPEFRVAELDFENNVARCDVHYTGNAIDVTNCVVKSLIRRRNRN